MGGAEGAGGGPRGGPGAGPGRFVLAGAGPGGGQAPPAGVRGASSPARRTDRAFLDVRAVTECGGLGGGWRAGWLERVGGG